MRTSSLPYCSHAKLTRAQTSSRRSHVCCCIRDFTALVRDAGSQSLKAIQSARPKYELCAALSEQERSRLAYAAACARDYDDFVFDSR